MQNNWISVYLYNNLPFEKVIRELLMPLQEKYFANGTIEKFFFIRYWENGSHLRLRMLPKSDSNYSELAAGIETTAMAYFQENGIPVGDYSIVFSPYLPETERYGGVFLMQASESFFEHSSQMVMKLIDTYYETWNYGSTISYAMQMHLVLAKELFQSSDLARDFFKKTSESWLGHSIKLIDGKVIQEEVEKVISFFANSYTLQKDKIAYAVESLYFNAEYDSPWLSEWAVSCRQLKSHIDAAYPHGYPQSGNNWDDKLWLVIDSHLHMTNNRLGIHLRDESFIAYLIFRDFESRSQS